MHVAFSLYLSVAFVEEEFMQVSLIVKKVTASPMYDSVRRGVPVGEHTCPDLST